MKFSFLSPQANDWEKFWKEETLSSQSKVSWSKRRILKILQPRIKPGLRVLDAGCGSGFFSKVFCAGGAETFSLDYSQTALRKTGQVTQGQSKLLQLNLIASGWTEQYHDGFDLIFTDGLMEHFSDDQQDMIMVNFRSIIKKEGHLVTFVPNRLSPWELIRPFYMPGISERPFILRELVDLNQRNGFKVIKKGGINTLPVFLSPDRLLGATFGMLLYSISQRSTYP